MLPCYDSRQHLSLTLLAVLVCIGLAFGASAVAPTEQQIVFQSSRDGNDEIYVMNVDGSDQRNLTNNPADAGDPSWSPDGRFIVFQSYRKDDADAHFNSELYVMRSDGSDQRRLTRSPRGAWDPAWSPDGRDIAFSRGYGLYVMNGDGTNAHAVGARFPAFSPSWSPDGQALAFVSQVEDRLGRTHEQIYVAGIDGAYAHQVTDRDMRRGDDGYPTWSPDGKTIVFQSTPPGGKDIYAVDIDGANRRQLTAYAGVDAYPSWSPDGRWIVYSSKRDNLHFSIVVMDPQGENDRRLTDSRHNDVHPDWFDPAFAPETGLQDYVNTTWAWLKTEADRGAREGTSAEATP